MTGETSSFRKVSDSFYRYSHWEAGAMWKVLGPVGVGCLNLFFLAYSPS